MLLKPFHFQIVQPITPFTHVSIVLSCCHVLLFVLNLAATSFTTDTRMRCVVLCTFLVPSVRFLLLNPFCLQIVQPISPFSHISVLVNAMVMLGTFNSGVFPSPSLLPLRPSSLAAST